VPHSLRFAHLMAAWLRVPSTGRLAGHTSGQSSRYYSRPARAPGQPRPCTHSERSLGHERLAGRVPASLALPDSFSLSKRGSMPGWSQAAGKADPERLAFRRESSSTCGTVKRSAVLQCSVHWRVH